MSIVPVVGYHLGQANKKELHSLWHRGMILMGSCDLVITMICIGFARPIASVFVGYNLELTALSTHALKLVSLYLLLNGVTIYAGSYFTGLNQGTASLVIALIKGIIGPLLFIWMLPVVFGPDAIWLATPGSEFIAAIAMCLFIAWWWLGAEDRHLGEKEE
jgi:Na+-driven multidrug efflux pump